VFEDLDGGAGGVWEEGVAQAGRHEHHAPRRRAFVCRRASHRVGQIAAPASGTPRSPLGASGERTMRLCPPQRDSPRSRGGLTRRAWGRYYKSIAMRGKVLGWFIALFFGVASALSGADLRWCLCEHEVVANGDCGCCCVVAGGEGSDVCPGCGDGCGPGAPAEPGGDGACSLPLGCLVTLFEGEVVVQALSGGGAVPVPVAVPSPAPPGAGEAGSWTAAREGSLRVARWSGHPMGSGWPLSGATYVLRLRTLRI
jgi:hypothetical protein